MNSNVKNVLYGTMQKYVLTPNEGYEVDSVEVFNKTANEIVPSVLEKTGENPAQWTLSFQQPAGMISVRPKMKPMMYTVVIEECENCNIVLLEYDDAVNIQVGSSLSSGPRAQKTEGGANFNLPQHSTDSKDKTKSKMNVGGNDSFNQEGTIQERADAFEGGAKVESDHEQSEPDLAEDSKAPNDESNSCKDSVEVPEKESKNEENGEDKPVVPVDNDDLTEEDCASGNDTVDSEETEESEEPEDKHDVVYDAGEFADELQEVQPLYITDEERKTKINLYWDYRKAFDEGRISKDKFYEVYKKHSQFLDDIRDGRIVVKEADGDSSANS